MMFPETNKDRQRQADTDRDRQATSVVIEQNPKQCLYDIAKGTNGQLSPIELVRGTKPRAKGSDQHFSRVSNQAKLQSVFVRGQHGSNLIVFMCWI